MSTEKKSIPASVRERVADEARHRCGYCLRTEELMGMLMTLDHIIPEAAGGPSSEENLWLACRRCSEFKGTQTHALDPLTGRRVRLFDPRRQKWSEHFAWSEATDYGFEFLVLFGELSHCTWTMPWPLPDH